MTHPEVIDPPPGSYALTGGRLDDPEVLPYPDVIPDATVVKPSDPFLADKLAVSDKTVNAVRSMLSTRPVLTGSSEKIIRAMMSRSRTYLAKNLWSYLRLESLSTDVGIASASLWRLTVCTTQSAWRSNAISFIHARFILFPKCSCIIGRIWLNLTKSLVLGISSFHEKKRSNLLFKLLIFKDFAKYNQLNIKCLIA